MFIANQIRHSLNTDGGLPAQANVTMNAQQMTGGSGSCSTQLTTELVMYLLLSSLVMYDKEKTRLEKKERSEAGTGMTPKQRFPSEAAK